jgi:hypothetical protein
MNNNNPIKQTIDVNSILCEIRNEIKEKGYTNDLPAFNDSPDQQFLANKEYDYLKTLCEVEPNKQLNGNKFVVFIKKIIRKFIKFYMVPIVKDQNAFNHSVVCIFLRDYEMKGQIDTLYERVLKLEELLHKKENA